MWIFLRGHDFEHEVRQAMMLFFSTEDDVELVSELTFEHDIYKITSVVRNVTEEKKGEFTYECVCRTEKEISYAAVRSAYCAAKKISDAETPWGLLTGIRPVKTIGQALRDGLSPDEAVDFFKDKYFLSSKKARLGLEIARREAELISDDPNDISVYIGIPFCPTRCAYCSFISHDERRMLAFIPKYTELVCEEIRETGRIIKDLGKKIRSVYIGGGTPTALGVEEMNKLFEAVEEFLDIGGAEYTVEAGRPDTISAEKLDAIREGGAGRISINPQTVHDRTLERIGRRHTFLEFESAYAMARKSGFQNINFDIIAGLPGETFEDFCKTVDTLLIKEPESLTVHTLYLKKASALQKSGDKHFSRDASKMVGYAMEKCKQNDLLPYYLYRQKATLDNLENVGYAKRGRLCTYNVDTMSETVSIFAIGAGGVTKIVTGGKIDRIFNYKNADAYIKGFDEMLRRKQLIYNYF